MEKSVRVFLLFLIVLGIFSVSGFAALDAGTFGAIGGTFLGAGERGYSTGPILDFISHPWQSIKRGLSTLFSKSTEGAVVNFYESEGFTALTRLLLAVAVFVIVKGIFGVWSQDNNLNYITNAASWVLAGILAILTYFGAPSIWLKITGTVFAHVMAFMFAILIPTLALWMISRFPNTPWWNRLKALLCLGLGILVTWLVILVADL